MKWLLATPPWTHKLTHPSAMVGTVAGVWPPTGILYLAGILEEAGDVVNVIDGSHFTLSYITSHLNEKKYDVIGISCIALLWPSAKILAKLIKNISPATLVMVGGPGPTWLKQRCLEESEHMDVVVIGEGENTIIEIRRTLPSRNFENIKGIVYRSNNHIHYTGERTDLVEVEKLPYPAFHLIDIRKYRPARPQYNKLPVVGTFTTRGCSHYSNRCIYCSTISPGRPRARSPETVLKEVKYLQANLGIKEIKFWDDDFTHDPERALEIAHRLKYLKIKWSMGACVNEVNEKMLGEFKKCGCWCILFGLESGVQKNLDATRKGTYLEEGKVAVKLALKQNLVVFGTFILGLPNETYEEGLATIAWACELNPTYAQFFACSPFPDTELYKNASQYGNLLADPTQMGMHKLSFVPYTMTKDQLKELLRISYIRFYGRPFWLLSQMRHIRFWKDAFKNIKGAQTLLRYIKK